MSESENTEVVGQDTKLELNPRKRIRHRKKQLYENILKQMEFYFSDANLTKDRFLGDLVKNEPYVALDVFLKFNKVRSMTQDINDIVKSMKHSTQLELSEDKLKVRRKTPVLPYDADTRTVYVESIPVTASREWLERVFSDYGHVAYISLPRFKNSNKIKGYGFIEFDKPEDAQKCINAFTTMGCKLPTCMPPEELSSIKMFTVEEPTEEVPQGKYYKEEYEPPKKKKKNKDKKLKSLELKLGHDSDSEKRDTPIPSDENKSITTPVEDDNKSITTPVEDENKSITTPVEDENKSITTPVEENKDMESKDEATSQDEGNASDAPRKKKTRKRTSKDKSKSKTSLGPNEAPKGALWGLQVLSKSEWKSLRNKYLNLQRKYMKELKTNLQNKRHAYPGIPAPAAATMETEPANQEADRAKDEAPSEKTPGVFVKEILPEPCLDVRLTKRTVRTNVHVLHVDVKEGQSDIVIRFDSANAADDYCTNSTLHARVLTGSDEEEQWSRAAAARGIRRARGRDRLLARHEAASAAQAQAPASPQPTSTHIRFEDE